MSTDIAVKKKTLGKPLIDRRVVLVMSGAPGPGVGVTALRLLADLWVKV